MAMTKKEREAVDEAIRRAELLAALRWTTGVDPDVPPPVAYGGYTEGWDMHSYSQTIERAWSSNVCHGIGPLPERNAPAAKNPTYLFSTKKRALMAMRHEIEMRSAELLLKIDKQIQAEGREND